MIKVIPPGSFDFGMPVAKLVDIHSRGIDHSWLVKRAAVLTNEIAGIKPEAGHSYIHLISMGAMERFGSNRNGDSWNKTAGEFVFPYPKKGGPSSMKMAGGLVEFHPTFLTHGHVFKHHCFVAGSAVTLSDRQRRPIEAVKSGDVVATRNGPRNVLRNFARPYSGAGQSLSLHGTLDELKCTADHSVLVYRRDQVHCSHKYSRLKHTEHWVHCKEIRQAVGAPVWVPACDVAAGDYLVCPAPSAGTTVMEPYFAELVGWVAADGYLSEDGIQFTLKRSEKIEAVIACLSRNGLRPGVYRCKHQDAVSVCANSRALCRELAEYVAGKKSNKYLTERVLEWNAEARMHLLGAFISGDGHVSSSNRNSGQLRIRSSSRQMLFALQDIGLTLGIESTLRMDKNPSPFVSPTNGKTYQGSGSGVLAVRKAEAVKVLAYARQTSSFRGRMKATRLFDGNMLVPVISNTQIQLDEPVYNLEIEGEHTYMVDGVVVHNCNRDPAAAIGEIKAAAYNDEMDRGELVIKVPHGREWDDDLQKLATGGSIPFSMAARVPYDTCTLCGNQSRTRSEYCDHLQNHMTEIDKAGHQVSAINDRPTFFDISKVIRPADRIAWSLQKVASCALAPVGGAELAELMQVSAPVAILEKGGPAGYARKMAAARKLAEIEKQIDAVARPEDNLSAACPHDDIPDDMMSSMRQCRLADVLSGLSDAKICLSVRDFLRLVAGTPAPDDLSTAKEMLPGMYQRLLDSGEAGTCAMDQQYDPSCTSIPRSVLDLVGKLMSGHSLAEGPAGKRLRITIIRGQLPKLASYSPSAVSTLSKAAMEYAKYQLAFAASLGEDPVGTQLTVLRNYLRV